MPSSSRLAEIHPDEILDIVKFFEWNYLLKIQEGCSSVAKTFFEGTDDPAAFSYDFGGLSAGGLGFDANFSEDELGPHLDPSQKEVASTEPPKESGAAEATT